MDQNTTQSHAPLKTEDVYKVDEKLPARFNNPDCFHGYIKKKTHPCYVTSNQTYGSKKPTVHEMPTEFNGSVRKFTNLMSKSGMYRDNGFNTAPDKSFITGFGAVVMRGDRPNSSASITKTTLPSNDPNNDPTHNGDDTTVQ